MQEDLSKDNNQQTENTCLPSVFGKAEQMASKVIRINWKQQELLNNSQENRI